MSSASEVVKQFLTHLNAQRIDEGMDLLAEDVFYHNIPMEPMKGREAVRSFAHAFGMGSSLEVDWQLVAIAESGDVVLTERVDIFKMANGKQMSIPLMGSFRVRDGLISEWRDYFDLADLQGQMAEIGMTMDPAETAQDA